MPREAARLERGPRAAPDRPRTLPGLLREAAEKAPRGGIVFADRDETLVTWPQLLEEAGHCAGYLRRDGAEPGDRVALLVGGLRPLVTCFWGAQLAGLHPTILPVPLSRRRHAGYVRHAGAILGTARPARLIVDDAVAELSGELLAAARERGLDDAGTVEAGAAISGGATYEIEDVSPDDIAFLQFTSGSTAHPRGVVLTHAQVTANVWAIVDHLRLGPEDVGGGWLPLFHDMGLVGNLLGSTAAGIRLVLTTPFRFLRRPRRWLEMMERHRISITAGPNVSYRHLLERGRPEGRDLSAWRVAIVGAEPVDGGLLERFRDAFVPLGMSPTAFMPAYGLAEVGLMVTGVAADRPHRRLRLDRGGLETEGVARKAEAEGTGVDVVGLGGPVDGMEVSIVDPEGRRLREGRVGVIAVRGPSVMQGYFEAPEATEEVLVDGCLHTGDLGFLRDGELFVTGRKKELIIVDGSNYYPQDIEWIAEEVEGVRAGSAIAFGAREDGREGIVLVASSAGRAAEERIAREIRRSVVETLNLPVLDVVLVDSGRIPRTTSGKRCRGDCQRRYEEGSLT